MDAARTDPETLIAVFFDGFCTGVSTAAATLNPDMRDGEADKLAHELHEGVVADPCVMEIVREMIAARLADVTIPDGTMVLDYRCLRGPEER